MGELKIGNFNNKEQGNKLKNPFQGKAPVLDKGFKGSSFSKNGVVEYLTGVKPRDDLGVISKVLVHVGPMERTILSAFPELRYANVTPGMKELLDGLSESELVEQIAESGVEDWVGAKNALWYLGLIQEVRKRDLDELED